MYNCRPILRTEILENIGLIKLLLFYRAALRAHGHECCHLTVACAVLYKRLMYVVYGPSSFELVPLQWSCLLYEPTLDSSVATDDENLVLCHDRKYTASLSMRSRVYKTFIEHAGYGLSIRSIDSGVWQV